MHQFEFSDTIDLLALPLKGIEDCVSYLANGFAELHTLLSEGVDKLVVRTSPRAIWNSLARSLDQDRFRGGKLYTPPELALRLASQDLGPNPGAGSRVRG